MTKQLNSVAVIGAGTMGNGIAQVIAASGITVVMTDISDEAVNRGVDAIAKSLDRLVSREKIKAADKEATLGRIKTAAALERTIIARGHVEANASPVNIIDAWMDDVAAAMTVGAFRAWD